MNISIYVFGNLTKGYTQYPEDYTETIFSKFLAHAKSPTQLVIHREGDLMYYGYVRKMEQGHSIGFCIVLNSLIVTDTQGLFSFFEGTVSYLITNGIIIQFGDNGDIVSQVDKFYLSSDDLNLVTSYLRNGFHTFEQSVQPLPVVSYGVSKDAVASYACDADAEVILKSCSTNGYTFIYKSEDFETERISSYKGVVKHLHDEKNKLAEDYQLLQQTYKITLKQKRRYRFITLLIVLVSACVVILLVLIMALGVSRSQIRNAEDKVNSQQSQIDRQNSRLSHLSNQYDKVSSSLRQEQNLRMDAESSLVGLTKELGVLQPLILKSTTFDHSTGYLAFDYFGLRDTTVNMEVRATNTTGDSYENVAIVNVYKGNNSGKIYLNRSLDSTSLYYFELLCGDVIIGGGKY